MTLLADEFTDVAGEAGTDARISFERNFRMELAAKLGIAPVRCQLLPDCTNRPDLTALCPCISMVIHPVDVYRDCQDRILITAVGPEVVDQSSVDAEHGGPEINEQGGMERSI
jgi:hypothetical protein